MITNKRIIAIVASVLVTMLIVALALFSLIHSRGPTASAPPKLAAITNEQADSILKPGLEAIERAIRLRDDFLKREFDFRNAPHIPELKEEFGHLESYFRNAVNSKEHEGRKENLEKVLKQMEDVFAKEVMSLKKWIWFHLQLAELFSDYDHINSGFSGLRNANLREFGKLDFAELENDRGIDPRPFLPRSTSFPCFAYVHDGVLGLQTLNLALVSDIMVLGVPTDMTVKADGQEFNPYVFVLHDAQHFSAYSNSAYVFTRFRSGLMRLYHQIENQVEPVERINDHLALFMFTHEMLPRSNRYAESLDQLLLESATVAQKQLSFEFTSEVYKDFDGIFRLILNARDYVDSNIAGNMKIVSDRFLSKYAPMPLETESPVRMRVASDATLETILQAGRAQVEQAKDMRTTLEAAQKNIWWTPLPDLAKRFPLFADVYRRAAASRSKVVVAQVEKFLSGLSKRMSKRPIAMERWVSANLDLIRFVENPEFSDALDTEQYFFERDERYPSDHLFSDFPCFVYAPSEMLGISAVNFARGNRIWPVAISPLPDLSEGFTGNFLSSEDPAHAARAEKILSLFNEIEAEKNLHARALDHLVLYLVSKDRRFDYFEDADSQLFKDEIRNYLQELPPRNGSKTQSIYDLLGLGDIQIEQITANKFLAINLQDSAHPKVSTMTLLNETPFALTFTVTEGGSTKEMIAPRLRQERFYSGVVDQRAAILFDALGYDVASNDFPDTLVRLIEAFTAKYKVKPAP